VNRSADIPEAACNRTAASARFTAMVRVVTPPPWLRPDFPLLKARLQRFLDAPRTDALLVAHITDLHLSGNDTGPARTPLPFRLLFGKHKFHWNCTGKAGDLLACAVRALNRRIRPDVLVVTGDIADQRTDAEAYRRARRLLASVECPVLVAAGDHDAPHRADSAVTEAFPELSGARSVAGRPFLFIPYRAKIDVLERLQATAAAAGDVDWTVLCMHRMLWASWDMLLLSHAVYGLPLLSPNRHFLRAMLERIPARRTLVLCGHSHTNDVRIRGKVVQCCTSALAEYPYEIRLLRLRPDAIETGVFPLAVVAADDEACTAIALDAPGRPPETSSIAMRD